MSVKDRVLQAIHHLPDDIDEGHLVSYEQMKTRINIQ